MKLNETSFRELDRKWIIFDRPRDIKAIYKTLKIKKEINPVLGYVYISHEDGIQIKIVGNVIKENNFYQIEEEFIDKNSDIPYSKDLKYFFTILDSKVVHKIHFTNEIEEKCSHFYQKVSILESRKIESIDALRHESYIDDVELILKKDKKQEYLWARIEDCSKDKGMFVCSLLDSSKLKKNYKEDSLVIAKVVKNKKNITLEIDGMVNKIEK
jgi:hypothetical protein